jgi:hypothetical protein
VTNRELSKDTRKDEASPAGAHVRTRADRVQAMFGDASTGE